MTDEHSAKRRAAMLQDMAESNRRDAAEEDARGNVLFARKLRERAEGYAASAAEILAKLVPAAETIAEFFGLVLIFAALYGAWIATPAGMM